MPIKRELLEAALKEDVATRNVIRLDDVSSSEPAVAAGENFTSSIHRVQLDVVVGSGKKIKMSLIIKELPTEGQALEFLESESFFEVELRLYKEVLPYIEDVLKEQGVPPLWPGFLGQKENYLIFSDLKSKNYVMNCRKTRLTLDHALLAVRTVALFHSASIVLKERGELNVSGYPSSYLTRKTKETKKFRNGAIQSLARTIINNWGPEWSQIGERLAVMAGKHNEIEKLAEVDEKRLNVICHGDLWVANMMFKYSKGLHTPIGVRFVDFQLATYNTYAFDLLYFMGTSLPADVRRSSRLQLVESYGEVLRKSLEFYGYSHLAPSTEEILKELKRLDRYFMIVLLTVLPVVTATVENPLDLAKLRDDELTAHNPKIYLGQYKKEVDEELLQWAKEGYF